MEFKYENNYLNLYENDEVIGYIKYSIDDNSLIVISTNVKKEYQGKGLARKLMDEIYSYALKNNLEIDSICSYGITYLKKKENS